MDILYVAFRDGDKWTKRFLKKGFSHCCILLPQEKGWLEINPTKKILDISLLSDSDVLHFTKVLRINVKDLKFNPFPFKFCTCVMLVEYMLGKSLYSFTPYRLYKLLTGKYREHFNTEEII